MTRRTALPAIEIGPVARPALTFGSQEELLPTLICWLGQARNSLDSGLGDMIAALVAEGRRFRESESGQRWNSVLEETQLVANGWMIWNMLDLDRFVTGRDAEAGDDTPGRLLEEMLHQLHSAKVEELVQLVNSLGIAEAGNA